MVYNLSAGTKQEYKEPRAKQSLPTRNSPSTYEDKNTYTEKKKNAWSDALKTPAISKISSSLQVKMNQVRSFLEHEQTGAIQQEGVPRGN